MDKLKIDRRFFDWKRIKTPQDLLGVVIALGFGAGFFPFAPGTMGTIVGIPIALLIADYSLVFKILFWMALFFIGTWASSVMDRLMQTEDNQNIVFDEVVGVGVGAIFYANEPFYLFLAFIVFRFFDVVKIFPVNRLDAWSKKQVKPLLKGFGVMADDLLAGIQTAVVLYVIHIFNA